MVNVVSSSAKEAMLTSFLDIVVGQTVDTAYRFLHAAKWSLEDVVDLFYSGGEGHVALCPSSLPHVEYTVLCSDYKHSALEDNASMPHATQGNGGVILSPLSMIGEDINENVFSHGSAGPAHVVLGTLVSSDVDESVSRKRLRSQAEVDVEASASAAYISGNVKGSQLPIELPAKRKRGRPKGCRNRVSASPALVISPTPISSVADRFVTHKWYSSQEELDVAAFAASFSARVISPELPIESPAIRKRGRPKGCSTRVSAIKALVRPRTAISSAPDRLGTRNQCCSEEEIDDAASASASIVSPPSIRSELAVELPAKRKHVRTKSRGPCHVAAPVFVASSTPVSSVTDQFVTRRRRRSQAEIVVAAAGIVTTLPVELVTCRRRRTRSQIVAASLASASIICPTVVSSCLTPEVPTKPKRGRPKRPCPLSSRPALNLQPYCKRTQLQLAAAGYTTLSKSPDTILHALGMSFVPVKPFALPSSTKCKFCYATKFAYECPTLCCGTGTVRLSEIAIPSQLLALFGRDDALGSHFRTFCRAYNSNFAFSCLGGHITASNASGSFTFLLHGQIYHYLPNLLPDATGPKFMQLYFYDGALEFDSRLSTLDCLNPDLLSYFITLTSSNPYATFFRSLRSFPLQATSEIRIYTNPVLDQRVYNAPTSSDVAAIIIDDFGADRVNSPHISVFGTSNHEYRIMHYFGCYDPLQYPLLFTKGESGWHQGLKRVAPNSHAYCDSLPFPLCPNPGQSAATIVEQEVEASSAGPPKEDKALSCRQYYAYRFQIRPKNALIHMGRLFVQYIVDMYVKIENTRLDYLRHNQALLRSELYQGVVDCIEDGNICASDIGRRVILPASFIGGPRDMKCRFLNAMCLVQKFGKPDLFITMTCNPNWPEIRDFLMPGENTDHRPDLVARVFNAKVRLLRQLIVEYQIFGPVAARVDVIEFQKRGLPHVHMLIILAKGSKIFNPSTFDDYVCAELPPLENTLLRSLVVRHMMHGPCGDKGPHCSCMKKIGLVAKCKCDYPKQFSEFTRCTDDSYPIYRRRETGEVVIVKGQELDNRWVVPYNPYLLAAFDCHLNVEICSTIEAVKYIYKYVYKGHDKICVDLGVATKRARDEISSYQMGRWVSGPESAWRIFGFNLYSMKPSVMPLQVHLPHMHVIRFSASANLADVVNNECRGLTMLTEYFTANRALEDAKLYLYSEFPEFFTWSDGLKAWTERKAPKSVGRLAYVSPCEGERYYLRLLLINVRGSTSFDDLLTYEGVKYTTFKEVAEKYSLLQRDDYAESCMREAAEIQMPRALRSLFATLLIFCEQVSPRLLWEQFYRALSEDFSHTYKGQTNKILQLTYNEIEKFLEGMGKTMQDFDLHLYWPFAGEDITITRDIIDALDAPIPDEYVDAHMKLNAEQRLAYDEILHHVEHGLPGAFFIDGPGGTGKTFLYCALYAILRCMGKIVLPTATSGIAASNMPSGRTAHSRFKIPISQPGVITCNVSKQSGLASLLRACNLFIWDEASMANKEDIEALDRLLQDLCNSTELFGGKVVVFGGDFRQVLPVIPHKSQLEIVNSSLVNSYLWPKLKRFSLHANIRATTDPDFADFLLRLGNGELQNPNTSTVTLPDFINCYPVQNKSFASLTTLMFLELYRPNFASTIFSNRAILTPTNADVDAINTALIAEFPGSPVTYTSCDSVIDDNCTLYPTEFLNALCSSGMSPHSLVLKTGCPVILLRNLDPSNDLCNGTRLICREFRKNVIVCEISVGYNKGKQVFIPRINLRPPSMTYAFEFERKQFPIKLCFAMTINKSQGQTLECVCVYLTHPCFAHGQFYVGSSRARTRDGLSIFLPESCYHEEGRNEVVNVVSFDILHRAGIVALPSS